MNLLQINVQIIGYYYYSYSNIYLSVCILFECYYNHFRYMQFRCRINIAFVANLKDNNLMYINKRLIFFSTVYIKISIFMTHILTHRIIFNCQFFLQSLFNNYNDFNTYRTTKCELRHW